MADYHSPTVVTPLIPLAAITALELLVLEAVFDSEIDTDGRCIYLFSETGPNDTISLDRGELASAIETSDDPSPSTAKTYLTGKLDQANLEGGPQDQYLDIDMSGTSWAFILQDIVRRSTALDEIVVTTSFTCSKMRPDGFGGAVTLITAETISGKSTTDMLDELQSDAEDNDGTIAKPDAAASSPQLLETALCVWEAMLDLRAAHDDNPARKPGIRAMMTVWEELGSVSMRRYAIQIADFALDVHTDLSDEIDAGFWSYDFEFIPALVENLDWTIHGPERHGQPEIFLTSVLDTLRSRQ
ncbi:hypothetical protein [Chelativorans sp. AA-79]|uniref:hypothetical protein n=1 Tax=Chelativorans sp. AA-79 TaxID=3028735 RepID=UPI0023F87A6D|nr:hypothetical protein [Chelativorans sp. AA-79]WEX12367.1 hypothetical protein PVE73_27120 [Chelativorans sp. AA-79]